MQLHTGVIRQMNLALPCYPHIQTWQLGAQPHAVAFAFVHTQG